MKFQRKYLDYGINTARDRFNVEFSNKEEFTREVFDEMKRTLNEHLDAAAMKFWAYYGWLSFSHHGKQNKLFRDQLFKNINNKRDLGVDVEAEIYRNFHRRMEKMAGNSGE